ncbi:hypothetical protein FOA52_007631 [Chlamydomonas sp. UWO 241]|nr:hypothetical protein FOA52_007631 [Chlamydomonas sp. UWO 241]
MHVGNISFCNHIGFNVKSEETKQRVLDELDALYGRRVIQKHHDKFAQQPLLSTRPHWLSLRSNGNPYFMYLTRIDGVAQCLFIDKKVQPGYVQPRIVLSKLFFDEPLFANTLFDGEMVKTTLAASPWIFLVNDIFADSGVDTRHLDLPA